MHQFPERARGGFYMNENPLTDVHEAVSLLMDDNRSSEPVHLKRYTNLANDFAVTEWEIVFPWYREGSSGGDTSGHDYYQIDTTVAERIVEDRLVEPYVQKQWGWSASCEDKLVLTADAIEAAIARIRELRARARAMLIPGIHTDLAGEANDKGANREFWRYGRFYNDFEMPDGRTCRVFPEHGEIQIS